MPADRFIAHRPRDPRQKSQYWKSVSCDEAIPPCKAHEMGWKTVVPEGSPEALLARGSGRRFIESFNMGDGNATFKFYAGQECFRPHELPVDRDPKLIIKRSDRHGNLSGAKLFGADDWTYQFNENLESRNNAIRRG